MTRWAKIKPGEHVELRGKPFEVIKIKRKGERAKVTVRSAAGTFKSEVALDAKVSRVADPLHGDDGGQRRWATEREADKHRDPVPAGDPSVRKPPAKPSADPWETRRDKVERMLDEHLSAHLVGESTDEGVGYYVPPVDITTIAGHLPIFHGVDPSEYPHESAMLKAHDNLHDLALGAELLPLKVNHWHTKTRPASS